VLWHLALLARIFASRMTYPMDAEWMEGGELYHAHRWLEGLSVYGPPSQGFIPYGYAPFHFVVLAAAGAVFGLDYGMGRAISILCFVGACAAVFRESWRQLASGPLALALGALSVGLAAAAFPVTGGWYDFVRNDTLAVLLPVLAAGVLGDARLTGRRMIAVAALLVAGVYTKQTNVFFAGWLCLYAILRQGRRGLLLAGITVAGGALVLGIAQLVTDGWFLTWITLMRKHRFNMARLTSGPLTVLGFAPYLCALPVLFTVLAAKRWLSARGGLWAGMLLASIPVSILPHIKAGGFLNNLMPVVFLAGATTLILCGDLVNGLRRDRHPRAARVALLATLAAASTWLVVKSYDPTPHLVTAEQRRKAVALNQLVRGLEGGVIIPDHPFLAARNGVTTPQAHAMAVWDAYSAGVTGDIFSVLALSPARWLLWGNTRPGTPPPIGKYVYDRAVDVAVPSITGHAANPNALFRRKP
jgi:hypothetical protein